MKISAWYKTQGHDVDMYSPVVDMVDTDLIYASKVFTWTPDYIYFPNCEIRRGGTGYGSAEILSDEIEHIMPDYSLYNHDHGIDQLKKLADLGVKVDFNQGLDARLINDTVARLLAKINWLHPIRLACDHSGQIPSIRKAVELLRWHNVTPRRYFCYTLVRDVDDALERVRFLKGIDVDPFAQPYMDHNGTPPSDEQKKFCRWVNHKAIFKSKRWDEYAA